MSGQWELVTKKKDKGSKLPIPKSNHGKDIKNGKTSANVVKLEEILTKSQVQNLYGNKNKENKVLEKTKSKDIPKKPQKKEKIAEQSKPKPPKSIESALNAIDADEFQYIYEKVKDSFPDAPIVWLKEIVQYLNQKIPIESQDPVFSSKPVGFPLIVVPSDLTSVLENVLKEAGKHNIQLFFDICLTTMATDMSKGLPATGYRIFLQFISVREPKLITANISKHVALRNSYQNRPNIGLSILWSVSHVGYKDFHAGLQVFNELFLPLLEMKNYSRYVLTYLINILNNSDNDYVSLEEMFLILNVVYSNRKNLPTDLIKELSIKIVEVKPLVLNTSSKNYHNYIETLLKHLLLNSNASYQNYLCGILEAIFQKDQTTLLTWNKIYSKNISPSAILLEYISNNWSSTSKKIKTTALINLLNSLKSENSELASKKRKEEGLKSCILSIQWNNEIH